MVRKMILGDIQMKHLRNYGYSIITVLILGKTQHIILVLLQI